MKNTFAMVFPGQGSQAVGMLSELASEFSSVKDLFSQASNVLGYDLWELTQQGPEEKLNQTEYTQPALLAADIALWQCWCESGGRKPLVVAGHSLGEYAALVCASALSFEQAIELVALRGRYMQAAVANDFGAMAAIIGLSDQDVKALCEKFSQKTVVSPANYNSIGQVVIAGERAAVERVVAQAKSNGAKLAKIIPVSVPSHCALMQPAADKLAIQLNGATINKPKIPVIHNVDVSSHNDAESIKTALVDQLTQPVRWVETIEHIQRTGARFVIECGPGKVLTGLNKRINDTMQALSINTPDSLQKTLDTLAQGVNA